MVIDDDGIGGVISCPDELAACFVLTTHEACAIAFTFPDAIVGKAPLHEIRSCLPDYRGILRRRLRWRVVRYEPSGNPGG